MTSTTNLRIQQITPLISPELLIHKLPCSQKIKDQVIKGRKTIESVLKGEDSRLIAIVGPCSVHDKDAALEYASKLTKLADRLQDKLHVIMRVYFEKPRTTVGWKGLINDPYLDDTGAINDGLKLAREILLQINELGMSTATEFVDTITPQYISDLISWAAIGARTTESQPHRMLASGLSMPVGFKNNTSGDINVAVNAVVSATNPHCFLSITEQGLGAIVNTHGNDCCHVILRGGTCGTNFEQSYVQQTSDQLKAHNIPCKVMVDCSHANSNKDHRQQKGVIDDLCQQITHPEHNLLGFMLESNLIEGSQKHIAGEPLTYGQSITDACVGWEETEQLLHQIAEAL